MRRANNRAMKLNECGERMLHLRRDNRCDTGVRHESTLARKFINRLAHAEATAFARRRRDQLLAEWSDHLEQGGTFGTWLNSHYSKQLDSGPYAAPVSGSDDSADE